MRTKAMTFSRHILEEAKAHQDMTAELSNLLMQMGYVGKILSREIARAPLVGGLGLVGQKNPTGDAQKKLDVYTNNIMVEAFAETGLVAGLVSEELEELKILSVGREAKYILCTDPLDGSSNTDINASIGTIFGIYRCRASHRGELEQNLLNERMKQVAAGYVLYGPTTMLVYTCGHGVHAFTLDCDLGEFLLVHENISCPARGHYYSANLGRYHEWSSGIQNFIAHLTIHDPSTRRPYSLRYTGALVADFHRSLLEGGIYFYPSDADHKNGKLRFLYECAPLAFIVEQAGGCASTGTQRLLDIKVKSLHQRVPFAIGSTDDVALYEKFMTGSA